MYDLYLENFYLESALSLEYIKSDINEIAKDYDSEFCFESASDVIQKIKAKIKELIEKIKSIFRGKAAREKDKRTIKMGKELGKTKIKTKDPKKVEKVAKKAIKDVESGKDVNKTLLWFKRALIVCGVFAGVSLAARGTKKLVDRNTAKINQKIMDQKQMAEEKGNSKTVTAENVESALNDIDNAAESITKTCEQSVDKVLKQGGGSPESVSQANTISNITTESTKALNGIKVEIHHKVYRLANKEVKLKGNLNNKSNKGHRYKAKPNTTAMMDLASLTSSNIERQMGDLTDDLIAAGGANAPDNHPAVIKKNDLIRRNVKQMDIYRKLDEHRTKHHETYDPKIKIKRI